jgi:hypothetical protein
MTNKKFLCGLKQIIEEHCNLKLSNESISRIAKFVISYVEVLRKGKKYD